MQRGKEKKSKQKPKEQKTGESGKKEGKEKIFHNLKGLTPIAGE